MIGRPFTASTSPSRLPRLSRGWDTIPVTKGKPTSSSISTATAAPWTDAKARRRSPSPALLTAARPSMVSWNRTWGCSSAKAVTTSLMAATSVASDLRNLSRAGTFANRSRTSIVTPVSSGPAPCSITSPALM